MQKICAVVILFSLFGCATADRGATASSTQTAPLTVDYGPLASTKPALHYHVPFVMGMQPVDYLQDATKLSPPLTYKCSTTDLKPCYETITGNCNVTEINGVPNQEINGRMYEWMWYIDGNIGALSPCIFSVNSPTNIIMFKLTEAGPK